MGIKWLKSYISQEELCKPFCLQNTKLIIDGKNISHWLMHKSSNANRLGGNYDVFSRHIKDFFQLLERCGVQPFVVMDGGSDPDDKKIDCSIERCIERIGKCEQTVAGTKSNWGTYYPILSNRVFKYTLKQMGIPIQACMYEADREIAILAKSWNCPVLSDDSDFYIFDLPGGVISLSDLDYEKCQEEKTATCLNTCIYYINDVSASLGTPVPLFPLLGIFLGGDYLRIKPKITKMCISKTLELTRTQVETDIDQLGMVSVVFRMLSKLCSLSDGFDVLSEFLGKDKNHREKVEVLRKARVVVGQYNIDRQNLLFTEEYLDAMRNTVSLPSWLIEKFCNCEVGTFVLNVFNRRVVFKPNLEDLNQEYFQCITTPLRQIYYRLVSGPKYVFIVEHHRIGRCMGITGESPSRNKLGPVLNLENMNAVNTDSRLTILSIIFQFPADKFKLIPEESRMFVLALNYFARNSYLKESIKGIKCLVFSHVVLVSKAGGNDFPELDEVLNDWSNTNICFDIELFHELQRFQAVIEMLYKLNEILFSPVLNVDPSVMYKGGLMYTLFTKTKNEYDLDQKMECCFRKYPGMKQVFVTLLTPVKCNLNSPVPKMPN